MTLIFGLTLACILTGCGTIETAYIPNQMGLIENHHHQSGIKLTILPNAKVIAKGEPISFRILVENTADTPILVPKDPKIVFLWVYPNGRRDNLLVETTSKKHFQPRELVQLNPGSKMIVRERIETYYFPKYGITEFRAILAIPENSNPRLQNVAKGRIPSNRYGVLVERPDKVAEGRALGAVDHDSVDTLIATN